MTGAVAHAAPAARRSLALWPARVLLGLMGVALIYASIWFSFFAPAEEGGVTSAIDWAVAAWAIALGIGFLVVSVRLAQPGALRAAVALVLAHVAFGVVKLAGYGESEAVGMFGADLLLLAALALAARGARRSTIASSAHSSAVAPR